MAENERTPNCNPVDPLLSGDGLESKYYKGYPTQPTIPADILKQMSQMVDAKKSPPIQGEPKQDDYKNFDIVRSTQYGGYERCVELIEAGYDVNTPDNENVSLLHWAAINNRGEILKYYISKGAAIDKIGGDLNSTPLHWATRQGHLSMVVLLLQNGADPALVDGEGCACVHLAAQFGHTSIVAYLIAKGQDPDMKDKQGMTPLMWAALRVFGPDPARLLLSFNASTNPKETVHGHTALHWACMSGNHVVMKLLLEAGADILAENNKGETALEVAKQRNSVWAVHCLMKEYQERGLDRKSNILKKFFCTKKIKMKVAYAFPFFMLWAIGFICHLSVVWWIKGGLFLFLLLLWRQLSTYVFDHSFSVRVPIAFYLATKFWMYFTWFAFYWPYVNTWDILTPFYLNGLFLMYFFWKAWKTDPGILKATREDKVKVIIDLSENQSLDMKQFCSTCIVRRPLRSKHCSVCNKCIAKFDHHCPWVDNCVGAGNHKYFIGYLFFLLGMIMWCFFGSIMYWKHECGVHFETDGFFSSVGRVMECHPWIFWITLNTLVHMFWVGALLACQFYQIMWLATTTNERINYTRYTYLRGDMPGVIKSPFNRGFFQNLIDLFGWRCCGLTRPSKVDWHHLHEIDQNLFSKSSTTTTAYAKNSNRYL